MSVCNMETFKEYLIYNEKSKATVKKYTAAVEELFLWLEGRGLNKENLLRYRRYLLAGNKPRTVNGKLSAINSYLKYIDMEHIKVNFLKIQHQSFIEDSRQMTESEYKKLLDAALAKGNKRLYMVMLTLCGTGIRVSELGYITVEAVKQGKVFINMKGKCRTVLLNKKLCSRLKAYATEKGIGKGIIFRTKTGKKLDRTNIFHEMKKLCKAAKVDDRKVFPHNFRHLFARKFYEVEKNLVQLADVLGHSRIETTRIYVAASVSTHQRILNKMKLVI